MRVGLFGGSFDPIHAGHVGAARAAIERLALDRVLVAPTSMPPHKPGRRFAPDLARYAMCELATLDDARLRVTDLELTPGKQAYSIESLERLAAENPGDSFVLLVGADSLATLDGWRRWSELLADHELGVFARPGFEWTAVAPTLPAPLADAVARAPRLTWVDSLAHPASASELRRRLAAGEPLPEGWLDPRVLAFARKYDLYR